MRIKIGIKRCVSSIFYHRKIIQKKMQRLGRDSYCILMYHRIINPNKSSAFIQPGMYVTPETFEMHLRALISETTVLPLDEIVGYSGRSPGRTITKPLCAITFDDGWKDFYDNAFPVLKSLKIPATVYLPTNFIGTNRWFWTDRLASVWKHKERFNIAKSNFALLELARINGPFEVQIEKAIAMLKKYPRDAIETILGELETAAGAAILPRERVFLNWQEVKEMRESGLVSFGSHTAEHHILTTIDGEEIERQLRISKQKLTDTGAADARSISFCYPNGNYTDTIAQLVKKSGYAFAVTTQPGWNSASSASFALKRIGIHEDITTTKLMFLARVSGLFT